MRINTLSTVNFKDLCVNLSKHSGMAKLLIGAPDVAALYELKQALWDLKQSKLYRGKIKQLVKDVEAAVTTWRTNLRFRLNDTVTLFDVRDFDKDYKGIYKEGITNDEYFEMWESIGGELYARTLSHIKAVRFKFKRHFEKVGLECPDVMAEVCMASNLLKVAVEAFECVTKTSMDNLPPTVPKFNVIVGKLNVRPILDRLERMVRVISVGDKGLEEDEEHEMRVALSTIADKWSDPENIHVIEMDMMQEYNEEIYNKKSWKQELKNHRRLHKELHEELAEEKRRKLGCQIKDRNIKR